MNNRIKQGISMLYAFAKRARGIKIKELKVLGIQLLLIAKPGVYNWNIFILYIPVLRIDAAPDRFAFNLLIGTWIFKVLRNLFTKWEFIRNATKTELKFCGVILYRRTEEVPFRFPTAMFHG